MISPVIRPAEAYNFKSNCKKINTLFRWLYSLIRLFWVLLVRIRIWPLCFILKFTSVLLSFLKKNSNFFGFAIFLFLSLGERNCIRSSNMLRSDPDPNYRNSGPPYCVYGTLLFKLSHFDLPLKYSRTCPYLALKYSNNI